MGNSKPKALAGCSEEEGKTQRVGSWLVVRSETVSLKEEPILRSTQNAISQKTAPPSSIQALDTVYNC